MLRQVSAQVLVLHGTEAEAVWPWFRDSVRHVREHVPHAAVREVPGAGHMGAWLEPERYAGETIRFFDAQLAG